MKMKIKSLFTIAIASTLFSACGEESQPVESLEVSHGDFVKNEGSKADSSVQAIFLDMEFSGTLISDSSYRANKQIEDQLLFTIGHLNEQDSLGRLDKLILSNVQTRSENGRTRITYDAILPVAWGQKDNVPTQYTFKIPVDMSRTAQDAFTDKYSHSCVDPFAHDVDTASMWYYYRATTYNCTLDAEDIYSVDAQVSVSAINTTGKYPEYDKIYEDDVLNVVAIFGKFKESATTSSDPGIGSYNNLIETIRDLVQPGDTISTDLRNPGVEHPEVNATIALGDGKTLNFTALLVDNVRTASHDFNRRYETLSSSADLIMYTGHAGLGANIRALARKGNWVQGQYAIVFMNGCDTYAYVDSALNDAHARVNPDDQLGTKYMDIVTNAMPAGANRADRNVMPLIEGLMQHANPRTFEQMFRTIASNQVVLVSGEEDNTYVPGTPGTVVKDWAGLTEQGNLRRNKNDKYVTPTLAAGTYEFTISGSGDADLYVRTGMEATKADFDCRPYKNGSDETCRIELAGPAAIHIMVDAYSATYYSLVGSKIGGGTATTKKVVINNLPMLSIPDNDPTGVSDVISVVDSGTILSAKISLDITHTYSGDLSVTLTKDGKTVDVFTGQGSQPDVSISELSLEGLVGEDAIGDYTLHVVDNAGVDVGTLDSWTLELEVQ